MKNVEIDQDACIACGSCYSICPDVYGQEDDGTAIITEEYQEGGVDTGSVPDDIPCTQDGADSCPVDAITVG